MYASLVSLAGGTVSWFPQDRAGEFYHVKGFVALAATLLLIHHMQRAWPSIRTWGQRLRYLSLLAFASLITFASVEQVAGEVPVDYRNLGGMAVAVLLVVAAVVSIHEDRRK